MKNHCTIDLTTQKKWIIDLFHNNYTVKEIQARLLTEHNVVCNVCIIEWQLKFWEVSKKVRTKYCSDFEKWITVLFYECCLSDKNILYVSQIESWTISSQELIWIHKKLNLLQKISVFDQNKTDIKLKRLIFQKLNTETINKYN